MRKQDIYRFRANQRAEALTLGAQLGKLAEETREAVAAYDEREGSARIVEELWDVIQAAEGALRKFSAILVFSGFMRVVIKSALRGDYRKDGK